MNRKINTEMRKSKMKKIRFNMKILFILTMIVTSVVCVYIIDANAKMMLGEEINMFDMEAINIDITYIQHDISAKIEEISEIVINIIRRFN